MQAEESELQACIGTICEFDQNEDTFSVYFDELEITLPKMVRNNILEEYAMQEKYDPCYGSGNSFLKFVQCVSAEQNNNNNENSDSSHFY